MFYSLNVIVSNTQIHLLLLSTTEPTLKVSIKPTPSTFHGQIFLSIKRYNTDYSLYTACYNIGHWNSVKGFQL